MTRPKTPAQKIGEWQQVYRAVRSELCLPWERALVSQAAGDTLLVGLDRTAAIVAAMLVGQNVRLPAETLAYGDSDDYQVTDVVKEGEADPGWPPQGS